MRLFLFICFVGSAVAQDFVLQNAKLQVQEGDSALGGYEAPAKEGVSSPVVVSVASAQVVSSGVFMEPERAALGEAAVDVLAPGSVGKPPSVENSGISESAGGGNLGAGGMDKKEGEAGAEKLGKVYSLGSIFPSAFSVEYRARELEESFPEYMVREDKFPTFGELW
jgi:hypothetical protein